MASFITALVVCVIQFTQAPAAGPARTDGTARAHDLIAAMVAGDFAKVEGQFDDKMKAALPPGRLAGMWETLLSQAGPYKSCSAESRVRVISDKQMVITACEFERGPLDFQFAFDQQ